jgi:Protein of unknown function (DUF3795)
MPEIIARCGNRCDLCPLYKDNFNDREADRTNEALYKYHHGGVGRRPHYVRGCDGCRSRGYIARQGCEIRACVSVKGFGTCAECEELFCSLLESDMEVIEGALARQGTPVPHEDYERYFRPFMIRQMLLELRVGRRSSSDSTTS